MTKKVSKKRRNIAMTVVAALASPFGARRERVTAIDVFHTPEFLTGIREGMADYRAGRVEPWSKVKRELGLGEG